MLSPLIEAYIANPSSVSELVVCSNLAYANKSMQVYSAEYQNGLFNQPVSLIHLHDLYNVIHL